MAENTATKEAIVIGAGPNGLAAAVTLAQAGLKVKVYEKNDTVGGACRSAELLQSGFVHDTGSAIQPLAVESPFFRQLDLTGFGLKWCYPPAALAHPFDDGTAVVLKKSILDTASTLDEIDCPRYVKMMTPLVNCWEAIVDNIMFFPKVKLADYRALINFGLYARLSASGLAKSQFAGPRAQAFLAGLGVHAVMPLTRATSAAAGLMLGISGHARGWPFPVGGAQKITDALAAFLKSMGGEIFTNSPITNLKNLPGDSLQLLDITPRQLMQISGGLFPNNYRKKLEKFVYGPGVFKLDWILREPIPWKATAVKTAGTLHLGGGYSEILAAENAVWAGLPPEKPFVILTQTSLFDNSRGRDGQQVAWAYCHVPHGSPVDMTDRIEAQIERFAPGFRDIITARKATSPAVLEALHPNCIGGDITGGQLNLRRLLFPEISYQTPVKNIFLCSATTLPGPGVHGMCGYRAAQIALHSRNAAAV